MSLMRLESLRVIRNKKNIAVFGIAIVIVLLLFFLNFETSKKMNPINDYQRNKVTLENSLSSLESNPDKSVAKERVLRNLKEQLNLQTSQIEANKTGDWKKELKLQISLDKNLLEKLRAGTAVTDNKDIIPITEKEIQLNTKLVNQNIHPVIESYETEGINFTYRILFYFFPFLMPLFVAVLIGDISTTNKMSGITNLVNIFPVKQTRILDTRILISFFYSCILIFVPLLVALFIGTIANNPGSWNYPIAVNSNGTELTWITISNFFGRALLLIICLLIFISIFTQFLNTFIKNNLLLMLVLIGCFYFVELMGSIKTKFYAIMHFIPFTFANVPKIINGESALNFNNPYLNVTDGVFTLLLSSILFYFLTILIINNKKRI
ncbi:hypothetical protein B4102_2450 [Heyndrickxia sporothermodurans]|uniref:Uncharacterized protein n=2 Tax=Bacillaceae TaxID=186817 RepID=A0A150LCE8_9BACI|nr:hypothetical protein B4102_2450 [Heyndrickxia sporothermodurans]